MKRVYGSFGSAIVLLGLWSVISRFGQQETKAPNKSEDRTPTGLERRNDRTNAEPGPRANPPVTLPVPVKRAGFYASTLTQPTSPARGLVQEDMSVDEQVALLRKPVIDAIRLLNVSKEEKYERMREALHNSGDSVEEWTRQAPDIFAQWDHLLRGKGGAEFDARSVRCYLAGCEAQVYFENQANYEETASAFRSLPEGKPTHGGRVQTPPKQLADGRWVAAWLMLRPNVAVE